MKFWLCLALSLLEARYRLIIREKNRNFLALLEQATVCLDRAGVPYWLDWGTLLGAIRRGSLIDHDTDVDISIPLDRVADLRAIKNWGGLEIQIFESSARIVPPCGGLSTIKDLSLLEITFVAPTCPSLFPLGLVQVGGRSYSAPHLPQAYLMARYGYLGETCVYLGGDRYRACRSWKDYAKFFWNRLVFYRAYFLWKGTPMPLRMRVLAERISSATYPRLIATPKT